MTDWHIAESVLLVDLPWFRIFRDTLENAQGKHWDYTYLVSATETVATIAITESGEVVLTRQYRHPIGTVIYDLPAGALTPGEGPQAGAERELEEETGYRAGQIERLGYFNQFPGSLRAGTHLFLARDLVRVGQKLDEHEEVEVVLVPFREVLQRVLDGEFVDGSLQLGMLLAAHRLGWQANS